MDKIFSKKNPQKLLHIIYRLDDIIERTDISPEEQFLQVASMHFSKGGKKFRPHKHIWKKPKNNEIIPQESWIVIRGSVKVFLYDLDGKIIKEEIIKTGDCSITFEGGHTYQINEDDTVVYEYKTGPYEGQENDKVFLNNLNSI